MRNHIGFRHHYTKLHGQTHGILLYAQPCIIDRYWISDETIQYDTDGVFPLPDGAYLQLVFLGNKYIPFTSYRKNNRENRERFCGHELEIFDFDFKGKEGTND